MPGRRDIARERAAHDCASPVTQLETYHLLTQSFPDRAVLGWSAILAHFHRLGIRRRNGTALSRRHVNRWRTHHRCPILRGNWRPQRRSAAFTTTHALTAWCLAQFASDELFQCVSAAEPLPTTGTFHNTPNSQSNVVAA